MDSTGGQALSYQTTLSVTNELITAAAASGAFWDVAAYSCRKSGERGLLAFIFSVNQVLDRLARELFFSSVFKRDRVFSFARYNRDRLTNDLFSFQFLLQEGENVQNFIIRSTP